MHNSSANIQEQRSNGRVRFIAISALAALSITAGVAIAYLTDSDAIRNDFTLDTNLSIKLEEPNFDPESAKDLAPTQTVAKDPTVENDGSVDAYIASTIKVPIFNGEAIDSKGDLVKVANGDLFGFTANSKWTLYGEPVVEGEYRIYTYVYEDALAPGQKTSSVFDAVQLANLTQDIGVTDTNIEVTAYAIQTYGFDSSSDAYLAYTEQSAKAVIAA